MMSMSSGSERAAAVVKQTNRTHIQSIKAR
jgi:hypothetical protein